MEQTALRVLNLHVGVLPKLLKAGFSQFVSLESSGMHLFYSCRKHVFEYTRDFNNLLKQWFQLGNRSLLKDLVDSIVNGLKLRSRWCMSPLKIKLRYHFRLPLH